MNSTVQRIRRLKSRLGQAYGPDRARIARELSRLERIAGADTRPKDFQRDMERISSRMKHSIDRRKWRLDHCPRPGDNPALPITDRKADIVAAVKGHPVIIVSGETGSGKTTQLPKFCLAAGRGIDGKIGCTQPRRIAATTVAHRIAEELGEPLGRSVGYKIRFKAHGRQDAFIKLMTDGILLAEAQGDRWLREYDTLIIDEAHERSLNIDFVLGWLKTLLRRRQDLKLIITSATIDTEKFSRAFDHAPVIEVSGRTYPVEVRYRPPTDDREEITAVEAAVQAADRVCRESASGDILVFMPTEQDIRETCDLLEDRYGKRTLILPLFARLATPEQSRVFRPINGRKIIVATNVAETSLTIPGIRYVIDTGLARIARYSPHSRTTALPVAAISRSSADQRKGRCGRMENGICIRLYSEEDFQARPLFTPPEILRTNLAEVILRMTALGLGHVATFPFIDRPTAKSIQDGYRLLMELGAIESHPSRRSQPKASPYRLTPKGRIMANIPIDPRLSRMLITAHDEGCLQEMIVVVAALSLQDPRERPRERQAEADAVQRAFLDPASDFISLLNIWHRYQQTRQREKTNGRLKRYCRRHFLAYRRMREWEDIARQILAVLAEVGIGSKTPDRGRNSTPRPDEHSPADSDAYRRWYAAVHRAILSGFLSNIAVRKEKNIYAATRGREVMIFPGSGLFNTAGAWVVAAEMLETSRLFARTVANIDAAWLEKMGKAHCRHTYLEPHWERRRAEVVAYEQVTLFGLNIVARRRISYGPINPEEASEIFVRQALVTADIREQPAFMQHNEALVAQVRDLENRFRRRDLLVDENDIYAFYKDRLDGVYDLRTLKNLLKKRGDDTFLRMDRQDLFRVAPDPRAAAQYPDRIRVGEDAFACTYCYDPGSSQDGITVEIPAAVAPSVAPDPLDWLVPGIFAEKINALLKGLPKSYRKKLVPLPETVRTIVADLPRNRGALLTELGHFIHERFKVDIPADAWPQERLPAHLKVRIAITAADGKPIHSSRDPAILTQPVAGQDASADLTAARESWEKQGLHGWDFDDLPETVCVQDPTSRKWTLYPGLSRCENPSQGVDLRLFRHRAAAVTAHIDGVAALYEIRFSKALKQLQRMLALPRSQAAWAADFGGMNAYAHSLRTAVTGRLFAKNIRTRSAFESHGNAMVDQIVPTGRELAQSGAAVLEAHHAAGKVFHRLRAKYGGDGPIGDFLAHLLAELRQLVPKNFIVVYEPHHLEHLPRYVRALELRARRGVVDVEKDQHKTGQLAPFQQRLEQLLSALSAATSNQKRKQIEKFYWMIEELKVSIYAQELKTAGQISPQRLHRKLQEIERMV